MLLARLYPYDSHRDQVGASVLLSLSDAKIREILDCLADGATSFSISPSQPADELDHLQLNWVREIAALLCSVGGRSAGLVTYDELVGAQEVCLPENYLTCRVRLSSELDIWRSGVVDLALGSVHVYTAQADLALFGACAYITTEAMSPGVTGYFVELDGGEPSEGTLRIPGRALRMLQQTFDTRRFTTQDLPIEALAELGSAVSALQDSMCGKL